jgi:rubredoxin
MENEKYKCKVCGFVYDPAEGDQAFCAPPGTSFEDLPPRWLCPVCGVPKDDFEPSNE